MHTIEYTVAYTSSTSGCYKVEKTTDEQYFLFLVQLYWSEPDFKVVCKSIWE